MEITVTQFLSSVFCNCDTAADAYVSGINILLFELTISNNWFLGNSSLGIVVRLRPINFLSPLDTYQLIHSGIIYLLFCCMQYRRPTHRTTSVVSLCMPCRTVSLSWVDTLHGIELGKSDSASLATRIHHASAQPPDRSLADSTAQRNRFFMLGYSIAELVDV